MKKFKIFLVTFLLFVATVYITIFSPGIESAEGTRSGVIRRISHKLMPLKTWEGELDLNTNTQDGDTNSVIRDIFYFSVTDQSIIDQIREKEKSGKRATLYYKEYRLRGYKFGRTTYDIYKVE